MLLKYLNAFIFYSLNPPYVCLFSIHNIFFSWSHAQGHFLPQCRSTGNTGQHSARTEGGANTLDMLGIILSSEDFSIQVPQSEVTDLKMTIKPFHASG